MFSLRCTVLLEGIKSIYLITPNFLNALPIGSPLLFFFAYIMRSSYRCGSQNPA